jgi:hypothetical protein
VRGDRYATTIRTFDRTLGAWHVNFINPADDETSAQLVARRDGHDIVMEGKLSDGTPIRWRYKSITPTSFHYTAEKLRSDGQSGQLYLELFGKRLNPQLQSAQQKRVAALLTLCQLGYAHWFFGNLYEAVVRIPDRLAMDYKLGVEDRRLASVLSAGTQCATTFLVCRL